MWLLIVGLGAAWLKIGTTCMDNIGICWASKQKILPPPKAMRFIECMDPKALGLSLQFCCEHVELGLACLLVC